MTTIGYVISSALVTVLLWSALLCDGQTEPIQMTYLAIGHFESEGTNPRYQCHLSSPDGSAQVTSFRKANTRNGGPSNNPNPPAASFVSSGAYPHWRVELDSSSNNAFGAFGCDATLNGKQTDISGTFMRSDADVVPSDDLFTKTVNVGDTGVGITMKTSTAGSSHSVTEFVWMKDNVNLQTPGVATYSISDAITVNDAGVYECFINGERQQAKQGLQLLIVRACPENRWGQNCNDVCNYCFNGGICDENTGNCICPPGFVGTNCETACGGNRYGYSCDDRRCSSNPDNKGSCRNYLFCLPHPFGCRCNTGWKGLECNEACDEGTYGASCLQTCHCRSGECNRYTGDCTGSPTGCNDGWTGSNCQEPVCPDDTFGLTCDTCHCQSLNACDKLTGVCTPAGCQEGWSGSNCQDACAQGSFGFDCVGTCHCRSNQCNRFSGQCTGSPSGCSAGWEGINCQDACDQGSFGFDCVGTCHCQSSQCDRFTGQCTGSPSGCSAGWEGNNCQDACQYPMFDLECSRVCQCPDENCEHTLGCEGNCFDGWATLDTAMCQIGIVDSGFTRTNPEISVPVTCTINKDPGSHFRELNLVISRNEETLDNSSITCGEPTGNSTARTISCTADGVSDQDILYCQLRKDGDRLAGLGILIDLYDLPVLKSPPKEESVEDTSVTITWVEWDPSDGGDPPVVGYIPYYRQSPVDEWVAGGNATEYLTFTFMDLNPETSYSFSVAAVRDGDLGEGPRSPNITVQTICSAPSSGPSNAAADVSGDRQQHVKITWQIPSEENINCGDGVSKYTIYYSLTAEQSLAVLEMREIYNPNANSYVFEDLDVGKSYSFQVSLTTGGGESSLSDPVNHLLPILPSLQNPPKVDEGSSCGSEVTMTWTGWTEGEDEGTPPIIGYIPHHKLATEEYWIDNELVPHERDNASMSFEFANLTVSTFYNFSLTVVRENNGGEGDKSDVIDHETTPCDKGPPLGAILGPVFGGLLLILLVLLILLWCQRKKSEEVHYDPDKTGITSAAFSPDSKSPAGVTYEDSENLYLNIDKPTPILLSGLEDYIRNCEESTSNTLQQQYQGFKKGKQYPSEVGEKEVNKQKNRFKNMIAYDHSRVILQPLLEDPHSDYYNANYIKNAGGANTFIACQGPNTASCDDFWRMVVQEKVSNIVMLTNLVEKGKDKCKQYWPESVGETARFGKWDVKWESTESFKDYDIRVLTVSAGNERYKVRNWHYKTWPDMDVPEQATPLIDLAKRVKLRQSAANGPLLVHCSAGVGRTGTFIALYTLMEVIKKQDRIDIFGFVEKMREDRIMMVQTAIQYQFLHHCLLECYLSGETGISMENISTFDVEREAGKLFKEFKLLAKLDRMSQKASKAKPEDAPRCRFPSLVPVESKRPFLQCQAKSGHNNFINACFCSTFAKKDAFIATQSPLPTTVEDFWRLIYDWNCPLIVMLNNLDPKDQTCCKYWPDQDSVQYGYMTVELKEEQNQGFYEYRLFELKHVYDKKTVTVHHMKLKSWDDGNYVKDLIEDVEKLSESYKMEGPHVVHCINGVSRTGVFLTMKSEMERSSKESKLDVFNSVRILRGSNHSLVLTKDNYILCHRLLKMANPSEAQYANI